jgi:translation initiation factor 1 (eIF-1/SUI1)
MENFEQQPSIEELLAERDEIVIMIENKRKGRKALEESGVEIESEEDDMDMQDLKARLKEILLAIGVDPAQGDIETQ